MYLSANQLKNILKESLDMNKKEKVATIALCFTLMGTAVLGVPFLVDKRLEDVAQAAPTASKNTIQVDMPSAAHDFQLERKIAETREEVEARLDAMHHNKILKDRDRIAAKQAEEGSFFEGDILHLEQFFKYF